MGQVLIRLVVRMMGPNRGGHSVTRRTFLKQMGWAPVLFLPAPLQPYPFGIGRRLRDASTFHISQFPFSEVRFAPHYPEKSPLDDLLRLAVPGTDEYVTEGYVAQIALLLKEWSQEWKLNPPGTSALQNFVHPSIDATSMNLLRETRVHSAIEIEVLRREFQPNPVRGRDRFLGEFNIYAAALKRVETADFEIYQFRESIASAVPAFEASVRYEIVGSRADGSRESRTGSWHTQWVREDSDTWQLSQWRGQSEIVCRASKPLFVDITSRVLDRNDSYQKQLLHGADYWRTVLDGAIGVDVYGNNGVAVGDIDNKGLDDVYICQPAGLPNRLYRNCGDGTLEDVTEKSGTGVLDFTACALFADFENRGLQDLLVVCATGPLLFVNEGNGKFTLKKDAFHFAQPPQGSFTHAAIADYDRDGRLDVYFCLYSYYQGLEQYRYPVPYFDARNGPPNCLFRNLGNWSFEDRTEQAGLNIENDRYSFASCWSDSNGDGWPDLYVVNDFGRNVLYRNNGDGTFTTVSSQAHVNEAGAGMSACWLDFDSDGKQDIYAAGMWVAAGIRIFEDPHFHAGEPEKIRSLYRRHMLGNSLYKNRGDGTFENAATESGVQMGRWSWSTDTWDFDNDGFPDLYVANGYISSPGQTDVSSFFWRQVVAKSPQDSSPSPEYERGWGAINELIRSDATWNGHERNVFFANNGDGTFSDVSGISGLDFRDDSRAFALADLDGDGRLEIILKNRNAPQVRILRNNMGNLGNSIVLRLRGQKSNHDAIGAAVTVESGSLLQTKYLQAGSGFLSQHTKELSFGLGKTSGSVRATIQWPSGLTQTFENLPVNSRIEVHEGARDFQAKQFITSPQYWMQPESPPTSEVLPSNWETWLVEPLQAPDFSLSDLNGNLHRLASFRGKFILLSLWSTNSPACRDQLEIFRKSHVVLSSQGLQVIAVNFDETNDSSVIQSFLGEKQFPFPMLLGTAELAGIYNIVCRYLFDRHRDLSFPTTLLIDGSGDIQKVYMGTVIPDHALQDVASIPSTPADRVQRALPFTGTLYQEEFQRNVFTLGVAFFQHGFLEQAERSFQQVIAAKPEDADAFYNLGTLFLRRKAPEQARPNLERAIKLRPNYPEAWNNMGMLAAQEGNDEEAIRDFQQSLELRPSYTTVLLNLGNLYRKQGNFAQSETFLQRAYDIAPTDPEINYNLGMLYARKNEAAPAEQYLKNALRVRPNYADALNNLGVLLTQQQRYTEAEEDFTSCIHTAPSFDQAYLNLARLYVVLNEKEKARTVLQSLLQKQPQHAIAQQMIQLLY